MCDSATVLTMLWCHANVQWQPRSQGLSTSHPLEQEKGGQGGGEKRNPGDKGSVVQKLVNANQGLKVNQSVCFSC